MTKRSSKQNLLPDWHYKILGQYGISKEAANKAIEVEVKAKAVCQGEGKQQQRRNKTK
jgi:hypothetical protein